MSQSDKVFYSDWLGVAASGLCAIHCTLTPLFFAAKPVLSMGGVDTHAHGPGFWMALDYVFLVLSLLAVWLSARSTTHKVLKRVLWIGWLVFAVGLLCEPLGLEFGTWLMYIGSITLVITHIKNYRYCSNVTLGMRKSSS